MLRQLTNRVDRGALRPLGVLALALGLVAGSGPLPARGQEAPDLVMVGARARGMGGAYVAVADGVESIGWNPAGLAAITQPELTGDMRLHFGSGQINEGIPVFSGGGVPAPVLDFTDSPQAQFTYYLVGGAAPSPFKGWSETYGLVGAFWYRRVVDGLAAQEQLIEFDPGGGFSIPFNRLSESEGGEDAWTLSLAGRPHSRVALGVNFNFITGFVERSDEQSVAFQGQEFYNVTQAVRYELNGFSTDLGATVQVLPELKVGAVLHPGYDLEQQGGPGSLRVLVLPGSGLAPADTVVTFQVNDATSEIPLMYGLGASYVVPYAPVTGLLVAADYQYRPWNEVERQVDTESGTVIPENTAYPTHAFHIGGEYTFNRGHDAEVPIRLGFHTTPTQQANVDSLSAEVGAGGFRDFRGDRVEAHTWAFGIGLHFKTVDFDVAFDTTKYTYTEFLFDNTPPPGTQLDIIEVEESLHNLYFSSTLRF